MAARLAQALLPAAAPDPPPAWLRDDQRLSFARALSAARRYGGVLLADRPGTGKSWIGLAVAAALEASQPIQVIAPAAVKSQWLRIAERCGREIGFHSCELLSRGRAPDPGPGPLVLDESHRLRNPLTRRYLTLAPWCIGRRGILLSATPIVNRLEDVVHQLLLLVRDDALAWAGIPSLRHSVGATMPGELGRLVVTGEDRSGLLPARQSRDLRIEDPGGTTSGLQRGIAALQLSSDAGTARLIRISLLAALASSPQAVREALAKYRSLLLHAQDAAASGRSLSRRTIRQFVGGEVDQLVLWSLVAERSDAPELALQDLGLLPALESVARNQAAAPDAKCRALQELLCTGEATLVFTNARGTVEYLRRQLGPGVAWCTGDRSGIDAMPVSREDVLDLLREPTLREHRSIARPRTLIATDIAAEGLDLPLTARVIHYDLPWTAVRLDQRSGRAFRLGSTQEQVEVIRFLPPASLEIALQRETILLRKAELPNRLGLGEESGAVWRLRARLAMEWANAPTAAGFALVAGERPALLAGLRFGLTDGSSEEILLAWTGSAPLEDLEQLSEILRSARMSSEQQRAIPGMVRAAARRIARVARQRLRMARNGRLEVPALDPGGRGLRRRLMDRARAAARQRDSATLALLERGLRLLRRGRTAGEELLVRSWKDRRHSDLRADLSQLGSDLPETDVIRLEPTALLLISPSAESG